MLFFQPIKIENQNLPCLGYRHFPRFLAIDTMVLAASSDWVITLFASVDYSVEFNFVTVERKMLLKFQFPLEQMWKI